MSQILSIQKLIQTDLDKFNKLITKSLETDNPILKSVVDYIFSQRGKQLRPTLVLLTANMLDSTNKSSISGATSIELLHTASLIHDDVIDDSHERRGNLSVNAKWNNKVAILSGDYILSMALAQIAQTGNLRMIKAISEVGAQLSDGELLQLNNYANKFISEKEYFEIIKKKTALLFSACMQIGALSVDAEEDDVQRLKQYGEYLGYCFQIKDDIFDYHQGAKIGKPTQNDVRDGKITLPLIYALSKANATDFKRLSDLISQEELSAEDTDTIYRFAIENGGLEYASNLMLSYKKKAIEALNDFPKNSYKQALIDCVEYAINRNN